MSIYTDRDFDSREDYLEQVAETYGLPQDTVNALADILGQDEDFDGLLSMCADEAGTVVMSIG